MKHNLIKYLPGNLRKYGREFIDRYINRFRVRGKVKIFCIGQNKTGTTSLKQAFIDLGFIIGNQKDAERLVPEYREGNFKKIIDYCNSGQVFQDIPFSWPETYKHIDVAFPNCKFILTVRDSPEQWYDSMVKFESKMFGNGNLPTKNDLQNANYVWKGWVWECYKAVWPSQEDDLYNQELLIKFYDSYNKNVIDYFKDRPDKLIVINVGKKLDYRRLMTFLNIDSPFSEFPWKNKTSNLKIK